MKKLVLAVFILIFTFVGVGMAEKTAQRQAISIEFVGESDRPVFPIIIATSDADGEWLRKRDFSGGRYDLAQVYIVSRLVFKRVLRSAVLGERAMSQDNSGHPQKVYSQNLIQITLGSPEKHVEYADKADIIRMLEEIEGFTKEDKLLQGQLVDLRSRVTLVRGNTVRGNTD